MHEQEKWAGPERRKNPLTETQLDELAEKAAKRAIEKLTSHVYQEVGRSVVSKFIYIVGACSVGVYIWLKSKGVVS